MEGIDGSGVEGVEGMAWRAQRAQRRERGVRDMEVRVPARVQRWGGWWDFNGGQKISAVVKKTSTVVKTLTRSPTGGHGDCGLV